MTQRWQSVGPTLFGQELNPILRILSVFVALATQHAMRMRRIIAICGLTGPAMSFNVISQTARLSGKGERGELLNCL
jgi:hypothetical protein